MQKITTLFTALLSCMALDASAQIIELTPTFDAQAELTNGAFVLDESGLSINTQSVPFANVDRRGILEFDLGSLSPNSIITEATLTFDLNTITTPPGPQAPIFGFVGDGLLSLDDVEQNDLLLGTSELITELGLTTVSLDAEAINSLNVAGGSLGILVLGSESFDQFGFDTLEAEALFGGTPATLNLTAVPEPSSTMLIISGLCIATVLRRRPCLRG